MSGPTRLLDVLKRAEAYLATHGVASPRLDAQLLMAHALGCDRVRLYLDHDKPLGPGELDAYRELVRRRARREPVAYLIGQKEFWSLALMVDGRVLIPRPDTETLLEELQARGPALCARRFADVGTGSGCLACGLAALLPEATGLATDRSAEALEVARANLARLGFGARVEARQGHLLEPLGDERFDLVVANLPYVPSGELGGLPPEVRAYEPHLALDGGADGLGLVRELLAGVAARLEPLGLVLLEVGAGQAGQVAAACGAAGLGEVRVRRDLAGIERCVIARAPAD
jgi:release factor glutamine methyltransferase